MVRAGPASGPKAATEQEAATEVTRLTRFWLICVIAGFVAAVALCVLLVVIFDRP